MAYRSNAAFDLLDDLLDATALPGDTRQLRNSASHPHNREA
jgi:hypothetical protein